MDIRLCINNENSNYAMVNKLIKHNRQPGVWKTRIVMWTNLSRNQTQTYRLQVQNYRNQSHVGFRGFFIKFNNIQH